MGRKIFVSYKYSDSQVKSLNWRTSTTVRDYVDEIERILDHTNHIYKGEGDDNDLSHLTDDVIWEKLKDRIYDSTLTIVLISRGMKETTRDRNQWIPWEISYSLKEVSRRREDGSSVTSSSNAMFSVILPDSQGNYSYYMKHNNCCIDCCDTFDLRKLFDILRANKFNRKIKNTVTCSRSDNEIYRGECSYIADVTWDDFIHDPQHYIDSAYKRRDEIDQYNIQKNIE